MPEDGKGVERSEEGGRRRAEGGGRRAQGGGRGGRVMCMRLARITAWVE